MLEKHIKLDYEVICPSPSDAAQKWEAILTKSDVSYMDLESAVKNGIYL